MKRLLSLRPDAFLGLLGLFDESLQLVGRQRAALASLHRHVSRDLGVPLLLGLLNILVARIGQRGRHFAEQQRRRPRDATDVGARVRRGTNASRISIHTDVGHYPVVSLIPIFHLAQLGITLFLLIPRRWGCGNQGRIKYSAFTHRQTVVGQVSVDGIEDFARPPSGFGQTAKLQPRRGTRCGLAAQLDAHEAANRLTVLDRIREAFVQQTKALLPNQPTQRAPVRRVGPIAGRPRRVSPLRSKGSTVANFRRFCGFALRYASRRQMHKASRESKKSKWFTSYSAPIEHPNPTAVRILLVMASYFTRLDALSGRCRASNKALQIMVGSMIWQWCVINRKRGCKKILPKRCLSISVSSYS